MDKPSKIGCIFWVLVILFLLTGEVKCVIKAVKCNWNPIGKAEVLYTGASLTGFWIYSRMVRY